MAGAVDPELSDKISAAGLRLVEVLDTRADLAPVLVARYVTQLHPEDGREDVLIGHDHPDLGSAINKEWEETAVRCGLFSAGSDGPREFLLGLDVSDVDGDEDDDPESVSYRWVRVSLSDDWDIAGVGCESGLLGVGRNNPTFVMMSVSGDVVMVAGYWQIGIGFAVARHPLGISRLREQAKRIASYEHIETEQRQWAERWVANVAP